MDCTESYINQQLSVEIGQLATEAVDLAAAGEMAESRATVSLLKEAVIRLASCGAASRSAMLYRLQREGENGGKLISS